MLFVGVDPGFSGAIAVVDGNARALGAVKLKETEHDIWEWMLKELGLHGDHFAVLEKVGAMPRQGLSSTFKFGHSYGFCRGLLVANQITFEAVTPLKWQVKMGCKSGGDKKVTKAAAQRLFPNVKMTHAVADAYLLAEYARRIWCERVTNGGGNRVDR